MDLEGVDVGTEIKVFDIQSLLNRIIEIADVGTLVLILVIFILVILLFSTQARANRTTNAFIKQSVDVVTVLTTVKNLMDASARGQEAAETLIQALANNMQRLEVSINAFIAFHQKKPTKRQRKKPDTKDE